MHNPEYEQILQQIGDKADGYICDIGYKTKNNTITDIHKCFEARLLCILEAFGRKELLSQKEYDAIIQRFLSNKNPNEDGYDAYLSYVCELVIYQYLQALSHNENRKPSHHQKLQEWISTYDILKNININQAGDLQIENNGHQACISSYNKEYFYQTDFSELQVFMRLLFGEDIRLQNKKNIIEDAKIVDFFLDVLAFPLYEKVYTKNVYEYIICTNGCITFSSSLSLKDNT